MTDYGTNIGVVPLTDAAGITQKFKKNVHYGIDIGWSSVANTPNCAVLAWQDGKVVDCGYGKEVGNFIVVQHDYGVDGKEGHRWTTYIHLQKKPNVKVGDRVFFGKQMGNAKRGNSGNSGGIHLHFYLTKIVGKAKSYSWATMKANCIDPIPYLYYSTEYNTLYISKEWRLELPKEEYYIVEDGDTLQSIADKHTMTLEKLCKLNPQLIKTGDKLRVK